MIGRVWAIALNTHREAVRQKILYAVGLFTVALILFSLFLGQLTLGADTKIIKDMGLASIMMLGCLISIFMGVGLVFKEVERRTIFTILSKPVSRVEFILGKFFGLSLTIAIEVGAMTALLILMLLLYREPLDLTFLKAVLLIYVELCILVAAALLFSSYSSSFMSILFCLSFLFIGHLSDDFVSVVRPRMYELLSVPDFVAQFTGHLLGGILAVFDTLSFDHFVINAEVVHGVPVSWAWILNSVFYGICWMVILLSAAIWLFRRRDFL